MAVAQKSKGNTTKQKSAPSAPTRSRSRSIPWRKLWGLFFVGMSFLLLLAFTSYLFTWTSDQSLVQDAEGIISFSIKQDQAQNWVGRFGASMAYAVLHQGFGIGSFGFLLPVFLLGVRLLFGFWWLPFFRSLFHVIFWALWLSVSMSLVFGHGKMGILGGEAGQVGYLWLKGNFGIFGTVMLLLFMAGSYIGSQFYEEVVLRLQDWYFRRRERLLEAREAYRRKRQEVRERKARVRQAEAEAKSRRAQTERQARPGGDQQPGAAEPAQATSAPAGGTSPERNQAAASAPEKPAAAAYEAAPAESEAQTPEEARPPEDTQASSSAPASASQPEAEKAEEPKDGIDFEIAMPQEEAPYSQGNSASASPDHSASRRAADASPQEAAPYTVEDIRPEGMEVEHIPQHEQQHPGTDFQHLEEYDPKAELSHYQYPHLDLVNPYPELERKSAVDRAELEERKNQIVETLNNYNVKIDKIKAAVGPTITLYEIIPEAGTRISRIKNLEDDIALSLAALGIRIIAPIPGRGTIGIEVPNSHPDLVPMRSILASNRFKQSTDALPIGIGKTISNEVYTFDLNKMPHLLIAGATGQGKSVGINVVLASLLYKMHPSQLKFVLVDPKKVELSLYNTIERHFLAKLPNSEEAIITDTTQVVETLQSLCVEMDRRYELLKNAGVRNIQEYNRKFVRRKLNPENGHRYLPYFVVVIDELADLMMTAGKEVEMPIARLAQLARAIGIHLVVATQRPSVNIITGTIKANFPARLAFRVTSKVDSRTILDAGGAEQLIGKGDMLFSTGSDLTRLQCAFLDTEEVEQICTYIGAQQGYQEAFLLPEVPGEDGEGQSAVDMDDIDEMFEDAARLIVAHQQGSTSLIQRKLKLGYNRAGRIMDQLEKAGVVGPNEGSKARQVLVQDEYALEQLLSDMR